MSRNPVYVKLINSARWRKLRADKLRINPLCEECETKQRSTLATEIHHRIPVESVSNPAQMERLMFNVPNLQSLCHSCHAEIHQRAFSHTKEAVQANNKRATKRFIDMFLDE